MGNASGTKKSLSPLWLVLFFLSGFTALIYQVAWTRLLLPGLGHEVASVLAVVSAFMAGMGIGSWLVDKFTPTSANSFRTFAILEFIVGLWGILSPFVLQLVNSASIQIAGHQPHPAWHWAVSFILPLLALGPATICMGATLPIFERAYSKNGRRSIGLIYWANTLGAVFGVLAGTFFLLPKIGLRNAVVICGFANLAVAVVAWRKGQGSESRQTESPQGIAPMRLYIALGLTGLLGIGLEIAGIRLLNRVFENTIYSFASALAVFLFGLSGGAFLYQNLFKAKTTEPLLSYFLCLASAGTFLGVTLFERFHSDIFPNDFIWREVGLAAVIFLIPCLAMGAIYSLLLQKGKEFEGRIGRLVAVNSFAGALSPLLINLLLLPFAGLERTLLLLGFSYLLLIPRLKYLYVGVPAVVLLFFFPGDLKFLDLEDGRTLVAYKEGKLGSVTVVGEGKERTLLVNSRFQMGGTGAADAEYRQGHLPLLMHGNPKRALFLGAATGITFGSASLYPNLRAEGVELLPEVAEVIPHFAPQNFSPYGTNLNIHVADARRFVKTAPDTYDVIVADLFHPFSDGAGSLYTLEHFVAVKNRLSPEGLFCQWLPLYQLTPEALKVITKTFLEVFPSAEAHLLRYNIDAPVLGLFSRPPTVQVPDAERLRDELRRLSLNDDLRIRGGLIATAAELSYYVKGESINTDINGRVLFRAPELVYTPRIPPHYLLFELTELSENLKVTSELNDFIRARNVYLQALLHDNRRQQEAALDAFIQSAAISKDFTLGYAHALTYAGLIARENPGKASQILRKLVEAQPDRPVARQLLERISNQQ